MVLVDGYNTILATAELKALVGGVAAGGGGGGGGGGMEVRGRRNFGVCRVVEGKYHSGGYSRTVQGQLKAIGRVNMFDATWSMHGRWLSL